MTILHVTSPRDAHCPECGSPDTHQTVSASPMRRTTYACEDCAHVWTQAVPEPPEVWDGWDDEARS